MSMQLIQVHSVTGCRIYQQANGLYYVSDHAAPLYDIATLSEAIAYCNALYTAWN